MKKNLSTDGFVFCFLLLFNLLHFIHNTHISVLYIVSIFNVYIYGFVKFILQKLKQKRFSELNAHMQNLAVTHYLCKLEKRQINYETNLKMR